MTPDELAAIKARAENATAGPWKWEMFFSGEDADYLSGAGGECVVELSDSDDQARRDDMNFIARARADVPALVTEVERCWELLAAHQIMPPPAPGAST